MKNPSISFDVPQQMPVAEREKRGERRPIYPERAFLKVEKGIERLKKIESGEIRRMELSESERAEILEYDNVLGEKLENVYDIKVRTLEMYPEYFLTDKGREDFRACTGFDIEAEDVEAVERFFYSYRGKLEGIKGTLLSKMVGRSKEFSQTELFEKLKSSMDAEGNVDTEGVLAPRRVSLVLNPEDALEKIRGMRAFKRSLGGPAMDGSEALAGDSETVRERIKTLYRKRANEVIMDLFPHAVRVKKMADSIGAEYLSEDELALLGQFPGMRDFVRAFSRYDSAVHGASGEYDENGYALKIGSELEAYADAMEVKYIENERGKRAKAGEKGLDFYKLARTHDVKKEVFAEYAESFFDEYGQKSGEPAETYDPNRKGPAKDGKWQYCPREQFNNFVVSLEQKVIKAPVRDRSMEDLIAILLGHEFTHFVQMLNQEKLQLRLYRKVCGDRRELLLEGGAMMVQNRVTEELFGYKTFPKVHYVRAMAERQKGGAYLDCAMAYYRSSLKTLSAEEGFDSMDAETLKKRAEKLLDTSLKSAKRLFVSGDSFDSYGGVLTRSKDTVYLEQFLAVEKLEEAGMEKYAFIRGLNLDSMAELMEMGFLDEKGMELPDMGFIRKVWEKEKSHYMLGGGELSDEERLAEVRQALGTLDK